MSEKFRLASIFLRSIIYIQIKLFPNMMNTPLSFDDHVLISKVTAELNIMSSCRDILVVDVLKTTIVGCWFWGV